jgi:hypothetical protein
MSENATTTAEVVETPAQFKTVVDAIEKMSVIELHELVKFLEKKFGVSAAAVAVAGPAAGPAAEEKSSFNLHLVDAGANKIAIIKAYVICTISIVIDKDILWLNISMDNPFIMGALKCACDWDQKVWHLKIAR